MVQLIHCMGESDDEATYCIYCVAKESLNECVKTGLQPTALTRV